MARTRAGIPAKQKQSFAQWSAPRIWAQRRAEQGPEPDQRNKETFAQEPKLGAPKDQHQGAPKAEQRMWSPGPEPRPGAGLSLELLKPTAQRGRALVASAAPGLKPGLGPGLPKPTAPNRQFSVRKRGGRGRAGPGILSLAPSISLGRPKMVPGGPKRPKTAPGDPKRPKTALGG